MRMLDLDDLRRRHSDSLEVLDLNGILTPVVVADLGKVDSGDIIVRTYKINPKTKRREELVILWEDFKPIEFFDHRLVQNGTEVLLLSRRPARQWRKGLHLQNLEFTSYLRPFVSDMRFKGYTNQKRFDSFEGLHLENLTKLVNTKYTYDFGITVELILDASSSIVQHVVTPKFFISLTNDDIALFRLGVKVGVFPDSTHINILDTDFKQEVLDLISYNNMKVRIL